MWRISFTSRQPGVTLLRLRHDLQQQEMEALTCSGVNSSRVSHGWGKENASLCLRQSICRNVETNAAIQTRTWQMACMRRPSGVNELHSGSSDATSANRRRKKRSCCSTLFKSCVSTETEAEHTAAAAAAVWLCRRNFKNRSRVWRGRIGRSPSK